MPEVLACGLGPEDLASYVSQQHRWARGCIGAIPRVLRSSLPLRRKAQYLLSASYFLSGWTVLVYLSLPVIRIAHRGPAARRRRRRQLPRRLRARTSPSRWRRSPASASGTYTFAAYSLATSTFWIHVHATLRAVLRRSGSFVVTPKVGAAGRQWRPAAPTLVAIAVLVTAAAWGLFRSRDAATLNNVAFALLHVSVLTHGVSTAVVPALAAVTVTEEDAREAA